MARFMFKVSYTKDGMQGVMKEGAVSRRTFIEKMASEMGGSIASFDFAFGDTDAYVIAEMPDQITAAVGRHRGRRLGREHRDGRADLGRGHRSGDREERAIPGPGRLGRPPSRRAAPARSPRVARRVACRGTTARASSACSSSSRGTAPADELGFDERPALHCSERQVVDRRLRSHERLELLHQVVEHPSGEPRADLTDPAELAVDDRAHEQRAERARAPALAGRPSQDHASGVFTSLILRQSGLRRPGRYEDPRRFAITPSSLVARLRRERSLPGDACRDLQSVVLLRDEPRAARDAVPAATRSPWPSSQSRSNATSETGVVFEARDRAEPGEVHPLLQRLERGPSGIVEGHDLAVDHRVHLVDELVHHVQLRVLLGRVAGAGAQRRLAGREPRPRIDAVELRLEPPRLVVERWRSNRPRRASPRTAGASSWRRPARSRGTRASRSSSSRSGTRARGSAGRATRTRPSHRSTRSARTSRRRRCAPRPRRSGLRGSPRPAVLERAHSVCTASRLSPLATGNPLGTAQDGRPPSFSRRTS